MDIYNRLSGNISKKTTQAYSTSFSWAIKLLDKEIHQPIYNIYGFVRLADEIVDSFHGYNKEKLLDDFEAATWLSLQEGISVNPILQSFQKTVNEFHIDKELIESFFYSMRMDLHKTHHDTDSYNKYIYGSAEVVGLMCLKVFCKGNQTEYDRLSPFAKRLGMAFQKINFLRDLEDDSVNKGRQYFPSLQEDRLTTDVKAEIEKDIHQDFKQAFNGIRMLPSNAKLGVYCAYCYYVELLNKIQRSTIGDLLQNRIRVTNSRKLFLMLSAVLKVRFNQV